MKRFYLVLIGLIFLFPCFLKAQKGEVIWERGGEIPVRWIAFSADSSEIYVASYSGDPNQSEVRSTLTGNLLRIADTVIIPTDTYILYIQKIPGDTVALGLKGDSLVLMNVPDGDIIRYFDNISPIDELTFSTLAIHSRNRQAAISINSDSIVLFDIDSGEFVKVLPDAGYTTSMSFTPDGNDLAVAGGGLRIWDIAQQKIIQTARIFNDYYQPQILVSPSGLIFINAYSTIGDCLPSNYDRMMTNRALKIWDFKKGEEVMLDGFGHSTKVQNIRFSSDFKSILSVDRDSVALTWDTQSGELLKRKKSDTISISKNAGVVSPSGKYRLKANIAGMRLSLWDNNADTLMHHLPIRDFVYTIHGIAFSPDEKHILASLEYHFIYPGSFPPQELHFWSTQSGRKTDSIPIPCFLSHIQVSGDNRFIAAATFDSRIIVISAEGLLTSIENSRPDDLLIPTIHPNPLRESGTISYSVSTPGLLKISVHDIFGREMMVVKNEFSEPGKYTIPFKSDELSSGTYFVKVTGGKETSTTHFSILR